MPLRFYTFDCFCFTWTNVGSAPDEGGESMVPDSHQNGLPTTLNEQQKEKEEKSDDLHQQNIGLPSPLPVPLALPKFHYTVLTKLDYLNLLSKNWESTSSFIICNFQGETRLQDYEVIENTSSHIFLRNYGNVKLLLYYTLNSTHILRKILSNWN